MDQPSSQRSGKKTLPYLSVLAALVAVAPAAAQTQLTSSQAPTDIHSSRCVLVSIPDRKLAVLEGETVIATFSVAVGTARTPSPSGEFVIINRVANPTYYRPGLVIPGGKDNPVGTRWLGLSLKGYGIHGTNVPASIGRAASHGCIRLRNRDMERLFAMLRVGDRVEIHTQRDEQIARLFNPVPAQEIVAAAQTAPAAGGQ